jgi:tetratricopeptide (TPR) repeat protein
MQLELFVDNRRNILLNDAAEMLGRLELEQATAMYEQLLADTPDDREVCRLKQEAQNWRDRLLPCAVTGTQGLQAVHHGLVELTSQPLHSAILGFLLEKLSAAPAPELIYSGHRFHIGCLFMEAGRYAEADCWFERALLSGIAPRGRFLALRGDALTLCNNKAAALDCYLTAFLEDPDSVDMDTLVNKAIRHLFLTVALECFEEEADDREITPWLPLWGWLSGLFPLDVNSVALDREAFAAYLLDAELGGKLSVPHLWYEYLRYAEYLRSCLRDDKELVRVRKRMKQLHEGMFVCYMERVVGAKSAAK